MADGYGSAPKPTGKGVKPVPYEPKPGPWGIDTSWLDTPQQTPRLDGAATSLPAPPPLADMHGGGGSEVVNMTNMRAVMEALDEVSSRRGWNEKVTNFVVQCEKDRSLGSLMK